MCTLIRNQQQTEVQTSLKVFLICAACHYSTLTAIMSIIPPGALIAKKIRANDEKAKFNNNAKINDSAWSNSFLVNYSSKYMNSIWGMYNRYSVHNLKKNMDKTVRSMDLQPKDCLLEKNGGVNGATKNFLPRSPSGLFLLY